MGTRADFYKKTEKPNLEWIGSIAWDGYLDGISPEVINAKTQDEYEKALDNFFKDRDDVTLPKDGWPWPWDDSETTDCAYCFFADKVLYYLGDAEWGECINWDEDEHDGKSRPLILTHETPNMKDFKKVTLGPRSGLIVLSAL